MKDYSLNREESKQFINGFATKNGEIIADLASGEKYVVPYNEENEQKILSRMKDQAIDAIGNEYKIDSSLKRGLIMSGLMLAIVGVLIFLFTTGAANWKPYFSVIFGSLALTLDITNVIINYRKKRELKKLKLFLYNQQKLNESVRKNQNMTLGMSKKAIQQIEQTPVEKPVFDINVIDNYSLSDLEALRANIDREYELGFDYSTPTEETGQAMVLRPNNNQDNN